MYNLFLPVHNKGEEGRKMFEDYNKCIECSVKSCRNHSGEADYCSLDKIKVGTHECNPSQDQCTDCLSFEMK